VIGYFTSLQIVGHFRGGLAS